MKFSVHVTCGRGSVLLWMTVPCVLYFRSVDVCTMHLGQTCHLLRQRIHSSVVGTVEALCIVRLHIVRSGWVGQSLPC